MVNKMVYKKDQSGLVSIMVASVLMVIMSLITLGFTRVVQSEQRQSIDNQLSKQAFYAAESGINLAASSPGFPGNLKENCDLSAYGNGQITPGNSDVVVTCVQINPNPSDIVFGNDSITTNRAKVVPLRTNQTPTTLTFQWKDANSSNVASNCSDAASLTFPTSAESWDKISPLRLELIRVPNGAFNRDTLLTNQFSVILYPCNNSGTSQIAYSEGVGDSNFGKIVPVFCSTPTGGDYQCQITINNLNPATAEYYAKFSAVFSELNVRITANNNSGVLTFSNAQAVVDSTGRAVDVYRRLQARVPLYNTYSYPSASIQTLDDVCKLYQVKQNEVVDNCN